MLKVKQEKIHVEEKMKLIEVQLISLGHKNESLEKDNMVRLLNISELHSEINPLTAKIFTVFGQFIIRQVLHKEAWVAKLQVHKKVKFSRRDNSSLVLALAKG